MSEYFWLIPLIPGVGAIINGLFGKRLSKTVIHSVAVGAVALSFLIGGNALHTLPVSMFASARLNIDASQAAIGTVFILVAVLVTAGIAAVRRWHDRLWGTQL